MFALDAAWARKARRLGVTCGPWRAKVSRWAFAATMIVEALMAIAPRAPGWTRCWVRPNRQGHAPSGESPASTWRPDRSIMAMISA
jgi:hypothetical protein